MAGHLKWITPFTKQCFVSLGQVLAMSQFGLVMGFTSALLPELRRPGAAVPIDDHVASWIVAAPSIMAVPTVFITPLLLGKSGRRITSIIVLAAIVISWLVITMATNVTYIFIARLLQGFSLCIVTCSAPICVGEYTSPKHRGMFLACIALSMACGTFFAHAMGSYISWQWRALISGAVGFVNLIMVMYSPETPSWLVDKGRYEEAKSTFIWLRGEEIDELQKMIEARKLREETQEVLSLRLNKTNVQSFLNYMKQTIKKPEFYKPLLLITHIGFVLQFSGINVLIGYGDDIFKILVGKNDVFAVIVFTDVQRLVTTTVFSVFVVKRFKRKTLITTSVSLNVFAYLTISVYLFCRDKGMFPNYPYLGMFLANLLMFSIASGTLNMSFIIAGEILAVEYRSISSVLCTTLIGAAGFLLLKSVPSLIKSLGLHGMYFMYAAALLYIMIVLSVFLPETKDKTLQDIEDGFKGKCKTVDEDAVKSLTEKPDSNNL